MDIFSKTTSQFPKKHHRCISLESGQTLTKKSYPKTPLDLPRFFPRRYSTPELAMRKHALKYQRDDSRNEQPISNKSCQTDILGLDKYLQRSPPRDVSLNSAGHSATLRTYKKPLKKPKVRSVAVHCERRRMTFAAFKGCQKFKHVYKRKISLPHQSSTATSTDDGRWDSGVLPKLRPDRTGTERPAAAKAVPVVKLPRIPTRDVKPDRMDDGGGGETKLAKLTRPQSTGSSGGGGSSGAERKLAYFRASSAPKIDSRYYTLITTPQPSEREQLSTGGSSDTADTTLDMSFVRQQSENAAAAATASTTAGTSSTTRTVSTSTTFTEPIFPIVFSCESVLRHPLDGGYVSHTESHRFSVHYVPIEDAKAVATNDTDDGTRSSLVFTSAGACQNERCLTGDSISVTLGGGGGCGGKPDNLAAMSQYEPSTSNAAGERRLVIEHSNADVQFETVVHNASDGKTVEGVLPIVGQSPADHCCSSEMETHRPVGKTTEITITSKDGQKPANREYNAVKTVGLHVLGKGDSVSGNANALEKATIVPPMPANKTIDDFDEDVSGAEEGTALESHHAHTDDMPLQSDERNNEQLTQNNQNIDSDRTVSNQSPKFDGTAARIGTVEPQNDSESVENDAVHASELDLQYVNVDPTERTTTAADTDATTTVKNLCNELTRRVQINDDSSDQSPDNTAVMSPPNGRKLHHFDSTAKQHETGGMARRKTGENTNRPNNTRPSNQHGESTENRHSEHNSNHRRNIPVRLYDHVSRIRNDGSGGGDSQHCSRGEHVDQNPKGMYAMHLDKTAHSYTIGRHRHPEPADAQSGGDRRIVGSHNMASSTADTSKKTAHRSGAVIDNHHPGSFRNQVDDTTSKHVGRSDADNCEHVGGLRPRGSVDSRLLQRSSSTTQHVGAGDEDMNACRRCTNISTSYKKNKTQTGAEGHGYSFKANNSVVESDDYNHHGDSAQRSGGAGNDKNQHLTCKRRLESVDEMTESKESNYIGGFLFGDAFYKKQPQKYDTSRSVRGGDGSFKHEYYDDSKKVNFSSKPNFEYYHDYVPVTGHSPRDEDCTVFADVPWNTGDNKGRAEHDHAYSTTATAAATQTSYYSQLDRSYGDEKNTDSDESLTDSLEDGCKYEGAAVSYFLSLNGQKSAVTFTLKMPNTLENRLNRRHSRLKKHLHVSTTVRKTSTRVRSRHKSCQTLWTEEKGVQVQRGSTANAGRKPVDDRRVLETLLAGIANHHVSENQIRVVDGQKMVSEGNQTEQIPEPPTDRQTQTTRDAAAGPKTPDNPMTGGYNKGQSHSLKKFTSDNALMVGVVRQNQYKGKEALDGAKNDQLLTLSKGWINFYTLRADSADTDAQGTEIELHDNDDDIKTEHDSQQYTVHVQAIPEPVTLPVVHVPNRNNLKLTKMCSTVKHLPKLVQTETNNHHCAPHLGTTGNGWCVSVDGPNNMHMKVSLLPDKSDNKTSEHFDHNEENKLESRRLALQRKNNYMRRPYRNIKRTQSTPRDMFSADVSRTESALSAESKYIETIDTQLLIHKARRRLSQEWDTRIQNGGVTESVQLVVTGDSVSSRASQHYGNRGHQHCSFRRQSRRI